MGVQVDGTWLVQLASSGATVLVAAAATDVWKQARAGYARLLGRGDPSREQLVIQRLDALAVEVEQAETSRRNEVHQRAMAAWQTRLADLIEEEPATAALLRTLRDELQAKMPVAQQQWVQNITASAPGANASGAMFGNVINYTAPPAVDLPVGSP